MFSLLFWDLLFIECFGSRNQVIDKRDRPYTIDAKLRIALTTPVFLIDVVERTEKTNEQTKQRAKTRHHDNRSVRECDHLENRVGMEGGSTTDQRENRTECADNTERRTDTRAERIESSKQNRTEQSEGNQTAEQAHWSSRAERRDPTLCTT